MIDKMMLIVILIVIAAGYLIYKLQSLVAPFISEWLRKRDNKKRNELNYAKRVLSHLKRMHDSISTTIFSNEQMQNIIRNDLDHLENRLFEKSFYRINIKISLLLNEKYNHDAQNNTDEEIVNFKKDLEKTIIAIESFID